MKAIKYILFFYLVVFFSVTAQAKKDKLRIGAILPLSGKYSDIGVRVMNTIQLTIFELDNLDIEIYPYDTKSSKEGAKNAYLNARKKNLNIFIGPITSESLEEIKNLKDFQNSFFFSFSNKETKIPSNVLNFGVNLSSEIKALDSFLKKRSDKIVYFAKENNFSKLTLEQLKSKVKIKKKYFYKNFNEIKLRSLQATNFNYRNKKHLDQIKRLKATGDEGDANYAKELEKHDTREGVTYRRVFIPNYKNELIASISFFDFYDVNYKTVQFITLNQWFNKNLLLEPSLENIIFPSINLNAFEKLNKKYKKVYGSNIENIEILAFDIVPLIASTWFNKKENYLRIEDFQKSTFKGEIGKFRIEKNKVNHELQLYKIKKGKFIKVKKT